MQHYFEQDKWEKENFENSDFKDKRLTSRLRIIVKNMSANPGGSIPQQMESWHEIKACYNFLKNKKISHKKIQLSHRKRVKRLIENEQHVLFIQDTTEIDYTHLENTKGLGFIGNHQNQGFMLHSCLAIKPNVINKKVFGLANQIIWKRKAQSLNKNETKSDRNKRNRESDIWLKNIKEIGSPPKGRKWISVGDRANDIYEYFTGAKELGWESVVRVNQNRCVTVNDNKTYLINHMRSLRSKGKRIIKLRKKDETKEREIKLNVSWEKEVVIHPPARLNRKTSPITLSVIRCWNDEEEIEWIIYSSIEISNLKEACEKINWYSFRWIIEEYHKCLKTGCQIESRQLELPKALEALIGILSIIALLMLYLRNISREESDSLASEIVDQDLLRIIAKRFNLEINMSVGAYWKAVARLGGFVGRKSDGEPGWQTLWKGWLRLLDMLWVYQSVE